MTKDEHAMQLWCDVYKTMRGCEGEQGRFAGKYADKAVDHFYKKFSNEAKEFRKPLYLNEFLEQGFLLEVGDVVEATFGWGSVSVTELTRSDWNTPNDDQDGGYIVLKSKQLDKYCRGTLKNHNKPAPTPPQAPTPPEPYDKGK